MGTIKELKTATDSMGSVRASLDTSYIDRIIDGRLRLESIQLLICKLDQDLYNEEANVLTNHRFIPLEKPKIIKLHNNYSSGMESLDFVIIQQWGKIEKLDEVEFVTPRREEDKYGHVVTPKEISDALASDMASTQSFIPCAVKEIKSIDQGQINELHNKNIVDCLSGVFETPLNQKEVQYSTLCYWLECMADYRNTPISDPEITFSLDKSASAASAYKNADSFDLKYKLKKVMFNSWTKKRFYFCDDSCKL